MVSIFTTPLLADIGEISEELERNGTIVQDLLTLLGAEDEARQPEGFPFPLRDLLSGYGQHDVYHIDQIRRATASP